MRQSQPPKKLPPRRCDKECRPERFGADNGNTQVQPQSEPDLAPDRFPTRSLLTPRQHRMLELGL